MADQTGGLAGVTRHDYLPFGEELGAGVGGRTTGQGYSQPDGTRQKFSGKERDGETGLDFFGARYYVSAQGRFTSPDPLQRSQRHIANPQRWNGYVYVLNSPLSLVDPDGADGKGKGGGRVIDVFILISRSDLRRESSRNDWAALRRTAKEKHGADVRVHQMPDGEGRVFTRGILNSLRTPGRYTVVIGHSIREDNHNGTGLTAEGIWTGGRKGDMNQIGNFGVVSGNQDWPIPRINAAASYFITCFPGASFAGAIGGHMSRGSVSFYGDGGSDVVTWVTALENAGYAAVQALASGKSPSEAADAANLELAQPGPYSDGDQMVVIENQNAGDAPRPKKPKEDEE